MNSIKSRDLAEVLRDEMVMQDRIKDLLREEPKTIPELAEALQSPDWEVTIWVMAMRRYGLLAELPKPRAEDYFQYTVAK
jgi:hypothetical protein